MDINYLCTYEVIDCTESCVSSSRVHNKYTLCTGITYITYYTHTRLHADSRTWSAVS